MSPNPSSASVIIASRDRPRMLEEAVASILAGTRIPGQIVIVDQSDQRNSALASARSPDGCELTYVWTSEPGLSRANNLGVGAARHDVLVFTHDDVVVEPLWLAAIVAALARSLPGVVTGRVLPAADPSGRHGFAPSTISSTLPVVHRGRIGDDVLYPMNMACLRATLQEVGGFDERLGPGTPYPAAEDNDLGHRLLEAGYAITYAPEATVHHRAWRDRAGQRALYRAYGRGQGAFYAKHLALGDRYMMRRVVSDVARNARQLPRSLVSRPARARAPELAYLAGLAGGMAGWTAQHRLRRTRGKSR